MINENEDSVSLKHVFHERKYQTKVYLSGKVQHSMFFNDVSGLSGESDQCDLPSDFSWSCITHYVGNTMLLWGPPRGKRDGVIGHIS